MRLTQLVRSLPLSESHGPVDIEVTGITADSRKVEPGSLYVAVRGVNVDGATFIPEAIARGAVAIVSESANSESGGAGKAFIVVSDSRSALAHLSAAWNDYPTRRLRVIGVTGTDGKTTTCTLIENILLAAGHTVGAITTVAAHIGGKEIDTGFHTTTPDAPDIQRYLKEMVDKGTEYAIVEATSHGLAQHRLDAVDFDVAVVTNITHEHLDFHGSWENYRDSKAMLFRALGSTSRKPRTPKVAVLNVDDDSRGVFDYLRAFPADEQIVFSARPPVGGELESPLESPRPDLLRIWARDIAHSAAGLEFEIVTPFGEMRIVSPLIGRYNVSNILAAAGAGIARRVPYEAIRSGVAMTRGIAGRMEIVSGEGKGEAKSPFTVIVDFAHTPNALESALGTVRELSSGRVIVVFGCAGLRDTSKRYAMGVIAGRLADITVVTAEDPRTESLDAINTEIARGLEQSGRRRGVDYFVVKDRGEAIRFSIRSIARPGDSVIVTGKGHERSMCFGTTEFPWSDQEAALEALDQR